MSNDNVDDAGFKNTFAIDVSAVHDTAAKLTGLDFHNRINHLIGVPADKYLLSIIPSLRWDSANMPGAASAKSTLWSSSFPRTFLAVISDSSAKAVLRQADVITPTLKPSIFMRSKVWLAYALHYHQICRSHICCFIQLLRIDNQIPLSILARQ